jgi:hypothetical protein
MSTIPASSIVDVIPNVVGAGGTARAIIGLVIDDTARVPVAPLGSTISFPDQPSVAAYFGDSSNQAKFATTYFNGYTSRTAIPSALLFTQCPAVGASAYLRGGSVASLTIPQLQSLSGTLSIVMDGYARNGGTVNLSGDNSFSAAAGTIQTALNTSLPSEASVTGSIAPETASVTASIAGYQMTVSNVASGVLVPGGVLSGSGVTGGTKITRQLSGTPGGIGVYTVAPSQTIVSETLAAGTGQLLQKAEWLVQVDIHGDPTTGNAANNAGILATSFRDYYATGFFDDLDVGVSPLYSEDPRLVPFSDAEQQVEERWVVELHLQVNLTVVVPQQFADALVVDVISVDATYPPV